MYLDPKLPTAEKVEGEGGVKDTVRQEWNILPSHCRVYLGLPEESPKDLVASYPPCRPSAPFPPPDIEKLHIRAETAR